MNECQELLLYERKEKIFDNFVSKFHSLKTKYSGINKVNSSDDSLSESLRRQLSDDILNAFGIFIDWKEIPIQRNDAMRTTMKLILNFLWGKLCKNYDKSSVYFVKNGYELAEHVFNKQYKSVYFDILDPDTARVVCNYKLGQNYKRDRSSIAIGTYVTSYARLKLWHCLNALPDGSVLYILKKLLLENVIMKMSIM